MVFSSLEFIYLFMPPVLLVYFLLRSLKMESAIIWWLVIASLSFYAWWSPPHLALLLGSIGFNYLIHKGLVKNRSKLLFTFGVTLNLSLLGLFKYADFLIGNFNYATGLTVNELGLILPLAISFFTFQQIAFLHDTWSGKLVNSDFKRYILFVSFFPQLIAGPIVMQKETIPQFKLKTFTNKTAINVMLGATLFFIGLFKKIVFADGMAPIANAVFGAADSGQSIPMDAAWLGTLAYTFQIYFDFSGYCDMALGLALLFGIRLPINFNSPYRALSIVDFWRRWHITLSHFLRDYLYIPLGGNRSGILGNKGNLIITMLLGGLWHGAGWNFIIWGGLHGSYLMINHYWSASLGKQILQSATTQKVYLVLMWLATMLAVIIAWVFFRAETFSGALQILTAMAGQTSATQNAIALVENIPNIVFYMTILTFIVALLPNSIQITRNYRPVICTAKKVVQIEGWRRTFMWCPSPKWSMGIALIGIAGLIQIYRLNGLTEFIYFNF